MTTTIVASAQERTVSGKVRDQQSNAPMHGVSVKVKGASTGTSTNESGDFTIKVPSDSSILVFTYVGYLAYEAKVGTTTNFSIPLAVLEKSLEDVIVVGYGTKKRVNVQGAVSTLKASEIEDIPVANLPIGFGKQGAGCGCKL